MEELRFEVLIDPDLDPEVENVVALGGFTTSKGTAAVYPDDRTALTNLYSDLILGRSLPLTLKARKIDTVGKLVAVALFLHRDLAIHPRMPSLIASASFVDQLQVVGLSHIDPDMARFFKFLLAYMPPDLPKSKQKDRLVTVVGWIRDFLLEDRLPSLPPAPKPPVIFEVGTNGFVLAEARSSLEDGWIELYRRGYLRGALFGLDKDGRRTVLAARKSPYLTFDLRKAAEVLNEAEKAMGEPPAWEADELWLEGPPQGTFLLVSAITKVLIRV